MLDTFYVCSVVKIAASFNLMRLTNLNITLQEADIYWEMLW